MAHARITKAPEKRASNAIRDNELFPWKIEVEQPTLYTNNPVVIDVGLRGALHAFKQSDVNAPWGWFVVSNSRVDEHDFRPPTRNASAAQAAAE